MKANNKDRIKVFIIIAVFLLVCAFLYNSAFSKPKAAGMIGGVEIINANDNDRANYYSVHKEPYGYKLEESGKYYLQYSSAERLKLSLTKEQYEKLSAGTKYWIVVKLKNNDKSRDGIVSDVLTENPVR